MPLTVVLPSPTRRIGAFAVPDRVIVRRAPRLPSRQIVLPGPAESSVGLRALVVVTVLVQPVGAASGRIAPRGGGGGTGVGEGLGPGLGTVDRQVDTVQDALVSVAHPQVGDPDDWHVLARHPSLSRRPRRRSRI